MYLSSKCNIRVVFIIKKTPLIGANYCFLGYYCVNTSIKKNIILTINRANPMKISQIATYLRIVNHLLYFSSSPAAVSIRKPAYNNMIRAIKAKIHNIRFTAFCIISVRRNSLAAWDHTAGAHGTSIVST